MKILDSVISLIPNEPSINIGFLSKNSDLNTQIEEKLKVLSESNFANIENLENINLIRLPFGGEFFESIIIEDDSTILNPSIAKQLAFALQKNRLLIVLTEKLSSEQLQEVYEPLHFSHFESIDFDNETENKYKILLMQKWFRFGD